MSNPKIETLQSAMSAVAACLKVGKVANEALAPIASAIALGIAPPALLINGKPFAHRNRREVPGHWMHFAQTLADFEKDQRDLNVLRQRARAGDDRSERMGSFTSLILNAVHDAFEIALRRINEAEQAEARRQRELKEKAETEEQRKAREARRAARDSLLAAAAGNDAAPEQAKPQSRRRTPESVTTLIASETRKWVDKGDTEEEARLTACRFLFKLVHDDVKSGVYSPTEIVSLKDAIKVEVQTAYFRGSSVEDPVKRMSEAGLSADSWMQRGEVVMARKDREEEAARKTASAPAAKTPAKPAQKPALTKAEKPAKEPAKPVTLPADAPKPETAMGIALHKALKGKAANG